MRLNNYKLSFFFLIFTITNLSIAQNLKIKYDIEITDKIIDSLKQDKNNNNSMISIISQSQKDIKNYPMDFLVSESGYSINFNQSMQLDKEYQNTKVRKSLVISLIGLNTELYNNYQTCYVSSKDNLVTTYDIGELGSWEITKETKKIMGYTCYKAVFRTTVSEVKRAALIMPKYAWFTNEIPLRGGPTIFGNLPGLILELETKLAHFIVTSIQKTDIYLKKIDLKNKRVMSFIESERYHIEMIEDKIKN